MNELIGLLAGLCTTIAFIPQIIKTIRTRDTSGISLYMYLIYVTGVALWITFGVLIGSMAVVATNSVCILLAGVVLFMKIRSTLRSGNNAK